MESGNLPAWAEDANAFFAAADLYERKNGTSYTEFELALPNELSLEENIQLVHEFVKEHIGDNKVYSFAIHDKNATFDPSQRQPHVHLMFCERIITDKQNVKPAELFFKRYSTKHPERGGYQKDNRFIATHGARQKTIKVIRASWAGMINAAYKAKGLDIRVSEKSLKDQRAEAFMQNDADKYEELSRPAEKHLGPEAAHKLKETIAKGACKFEELSDKARLALIAREIRKIALEMAALNKEIKEIRAARAAEAAKLEGIRTELKETKLDDVVIQGSRLKTTLHETSMALAKQINLNKDRIKVLEKRILSEDSIRSIAASVYTKGRSKRLARELQKLEQSKEKLSTDYAKFKEQPKPRFYQLDYKRSYRQQEQSLQMRSKTLEEQEAKLSLEKAALDKELQRKDVRKRVESIENTLRTRNYIRENQIKKLMNTNKSLAKLGYSCLHLENRVKGRMKYKLKQECLKAIKQVVVKDIQGSLDNIKNALNKSRDEEVKGHMRANLRVDVSDGMER